MRNFILFSVKHPISILMLYIAILLGSLVALNNIQVDFLPKMRDRYLLVNADFEGIPADEMKKLVTIPIEDSLASLKGIKNISSVTRDGLSLVKVELQWNIDSDLALVECKELIDQCYEILPNGCEKPAARIFNPSAKETIMLAVIPKDNDLEYAKFIVENDIKPRLQRISGVSSVLLSGGDKAEIQVVPDKIKMEAMGLTLQSIAEITAGANYEYPAGTVEEGSKQFLFKTNGLYKNISEINETPAGYTDNGMILLGDICTVKYVAQERKTFFNLNGKDAVSLSIFKKNEVSPSKLSNVVKSEIEELKNIYGDSYEFTILIDKSDQLKDSLQQLCVSVFFGIIITVLVILLFFHNGVLAIIISSIMPFCILFSVLVLTVCGKSINLMSLSGIAIGIGMVIDPSIVCIENILSNYKNNTDKFCDITSLVYESTVQVSVSATASAITTVVVFIPFFFLSEIMGQLFSDLSIAVIASVAFACVLSLSFVPALLKIILEKNKFESKFLDFSKVERFYENSLLKKSENAFFIPFVFICCIILGMVCLKLLPKEILPKSYNNNISVTIYFDENTSLSFINKNSDYIYYMLKNDDNILFYCSSGGIEKDSYEELCEPNIRKEKLTVKIRTTNVKTTKNKLQEILKNSNLAFFIDSDLSILEEVLKTNGDTILYAENEGSLKSVLEKNELKNLKFIPNSVAKELEYEPDRTACARFNISSVQTAKIIYDTLEGVESCDFYSKGRNIPIRIKFNADDITDIHQLPETKILAGNYSVPISAIGTIKYVENEKIFYRYNRNEAKILQDFPAELDDIKNIIFLGKIQFSEFVKNAVFLIILVLFLLYCVMGAQFESFVIPCFILLAIPPAFSGAFLLLLVTGQSVNINSIIALVVLFGTTVNNAIILYEAIVQTKIKCFSDVVSCCVKKLQPITITTLTTICAIIPFSIDPLHKNSQSSMTIAIIGGLLLSYFVVLYCIPQILFKFSTRRGKNEE